MTTNWEARNRPALAEQSPKSDTETPFPNLPGFEFRLIGTSELDQIHKTSLRFRFWSYQFIGRSVHTRRHAARWVPCPWCLDLRWPDMTSSNSAPRPDLKGKSARPSVNFHSPFSWVGAHHGIVIHGLWWHTMAFHNYRCCMLFLSLRCI